MRRVAVLNQKGGVGKTTTVTNLGAALAVEGRRVLLVDLDPQSHLTLHLGIDGQTVTGTTYDLLTDGASVDSMLLNPRTNLFLLPAHIDLAAAEMELVSVVGRETILRNALNGTAHEFDVMLVDCPPSLSVLTVNALAAVDEVLIPLQPHFLALQGLGKLLETVQLVHHRLNPALRVTGIVLCLFESGTRLAAEVVDDLRRFLEGSRELDVPWSRATIFQTVIRRNIKLAESPSHGVTIFDYAPKSSGAKDYTALAAEMWASPIPSEADPESVAAVGRALPAVSSPMTPFVHHAAGGTPRTTQCPIPSEAHPESVERLAKLA